MVIVSRASMLSICATPECSTIVFGQGTCVEHDERDSAGAESRPTDAAIRSEHPEAAAQTLSPAV